METTLMPPKTKPPQKTATVPPDELEPMVSTAEVERWFGLSRVKLAQLVRTKKIPPPYVFGQRAHRWAFSELRAAVEKLRREK